VSVWQCCFSNGGHYLAAIYGNVVMIYSTTTFDNVSNLKGHNGKVKSVVWSSDDMRIATCGVDGAVYEWEVLTGRRAAENVLKLCSYAGVALSPDAKTTFAVGSDHTLKEISDSQVTWISVSLSLFSSKYCLCFKHFVYCVMINKE